MAEGFKAVLPPREAHARVGCVTEIAQLNEVVHMPFHDLNERAARGRLAQEPAWQAFLGKVRRAWPTCRR